MWFLRRPSVRHRPGNATIVGDTPVITGITVYGADGGMAPHALHARANVSDSDGSTTGSGWWPEGRWEFAFVKEDESDLDTGDQEYMQVLDPITNIMTNTDHRFGASPNASFVFKSSGTYKVMIRYQNRDHLWSSWLSSGTITVTANTRTKLYVNGSIGNDSNDGLTALTAKATLNGALNLVDGDDFEIEIADDTSCDVDAAINTSAFDGLYIHGSGDGTNRPIIVVKAGGPIIPGSRFVVESVEFEYDGVTRFSIFGFNSGESASFIDVSYNEVQSFCEIASGACPNGVLWLRCEQKEATNRYSIYADSFDCLNVLGCNFTGGSLTEHTCRFMNGIAVPQSQYLHAEYSTFDYSGVDTAKTAFGNATDRHSGLHRCVVARGGFNFGAGNMGDSTAQEICVSSCHFIFDAPGALQGMNCIEGMKHIVYRTCLIEKTVTTNNPLFTFKDRPGGGDGLVIEGFKILNCSIKLTGDTDAPTMDMENALTASPTEVEIRGNIFVHDPADSTNIFSQRFFFKATGVTFKENVHTAIPDFPDEFDFGGTLYTVAEANGTVASGLVIEDQDFAADGEPTGSGGEWRTTSTSLRGIFEDIKGSAWDLVGAAGCWFPGV